ncbi:unnamed protein product [Phytophthora lilii]|uniref:Unnamed protein product n=1 Tax=Phytophthora lilii TaxID=2077276 RepID=A0A9W6XB82_9STRA|nr:unnamed protein product [Phytophthora lilii]
MMAPSSTAIILLQMAGLATAKEIASKAEYTIVVIGGERTLRNRRHQRPGVFANDRGRGGGDHSGVGRSASLASLTGSPP